MGRAPCCDKANVKKGPWSPEEDAKLKDFIDKYGTGGNWIALPQKAGLKRCGKSCRLRWLNYLRPNIKHGDFSDEEDRIICSLFASIGTRWSIIASQLPGRTDNDIKNYWNTKLKKKMLAGINIAQNSQRKPNQAQQYYQGQLVFSSSPSPQTSCYTTQMPLLTSPDHHQSFHSMSQDLLINTTTTATTSTTVCNLLQVPHHEYQVKDECSNMIAFNTADQSCSSSDGSCTQISYGNYKELDLYDEYALKGDQMKYGNLLFGGNVAQQFGLDKLVVNSDQTHDCGTSTSLMEYNYEEMKQLIMKNFNSGCNYNIIMNNSMHLDFPHQK